MKLKWVFSPTTLPELSNFSNIERERIWHNNRHKGVWRLSTWFAFVTGVIWLLLIILLKYKIIEKYPSFDGILIDIVVLIVGFGGSVLYLSARKLSNTRPFIKEYIESNYPDYPSKE